ncbi:MAG: energy-coupling factor transporter transmembrane protein EcfT [Chloroflexi bacterium]|nr:energy-coupling factor transporter transmembrane protein EcfT [Chloroflexota bacterium]
MSEFEYLKNLSMGQYLPVRSCIHQRDPRGKLIAAALLVFSLTLSNSLIGVGFGLIAVLFLLLLSKVPANHALRSLLPPLPFLVFLAVLQIFITPHASGAEPIVRILGIGIFLEGFRSAFLLLMKFLGLIVLFSILSASISTLELIHGLDLLLKPLKRIGIHTGVAAMTVQIVFRFVPFLAISAERIAKAQASRGADWESGRVNLVKKVRQIVPLLVPLFSSSLRQAETLADAMLARGFESSHARTGILEYQFTWQDAVFLLGIGIAAYLILFLKY